MVSLSVAILVLGAFAVVFYLGTRYGRTAEQYVVAEALARYRHIDVAAGIAVTNLLNTLKADYAKAFLEVVDEIDQTIATAKKIVAAGEKAL